MNSGMNSGMSSGTNYGMNCKDIREDLSAHLDGELDPARRAEIDGHLASCDGCRAELERLRRLSKLLGDVPRAAAPAGLASRIVAAARVPRPRILRLPRWTGALAAAAAALLVGVVSFVAMRREEEPARDMATPAAVRGAAELAGTPAAPAEEGAALEDAAAGELKARKMPAPRGAPAAGAPSRVAVDKEKLEKLVATFRGTSSDRAHRPEERGDLAMKKTAPAPAEPAPAAGPRASRARRGVAPRVGGKGKAAAPPLAPADKRLSAGRPSASATAARAPRPAREAKAEAGSRAPRKPLLGRRIGFEATQGKARRVARPEAAKEAARTPAAADEVASSRARAERDAGRAATRPEAERPAGTRRRQADLLGQREREGERAGAAKAAGAVKTKVVALPRRRKADARARELKKKADKPFVRVRLEPDDPVLLRIREIAKRFGGAVTGTAFDDLAGGWRSTALVRLPLERSRDFLAAIEGLTLPEAEEKAAEKPEADRAPARALAAPARSKATPKPATPEAGGQSTKPVRWVTIEIVVESLAPRSPVGR